MAAFDPPFLHPLGTLGQPGLTASSSVNLMLSIEEAFGKMKGLLRKVEVRSPEVLLESIGTAISAITDQDARGFFEHCGYRMPVQTLW